MQYTKNKLGIDIAKASFEVFLIGEGISKGGHFSNDRRGYEALSQWLRSKVSRRCMRAWNRPVGMEKDWRRRCMSRGMN